MKKCEKKSGVRNSGSILLNDSCKSRSTTDPGKLRVRLCVRYQVAYGVRVSEAHLARPVEYISAMHRKSALVLTHARFRVCACLPQQMHSPAGRHCEQTRTVSTNSEN